MLSQSRSRLPGGTFFLPAISVVFCRKVPPGARDLPNIHTRSSE